MNVIAFYPEDVRHLVTARELLTGLMIDAADNGHTVQGADEAFECVERLLDRMWAATYSLPIVGNPLRPFNPHGFSRKVGAPGLDGYALGDPKRVGLETDGRGLRG